MSHRFFPCISKSRTLRHTSADPIEDGRTYPKRSEGESGYRHKYNFHRPLRELHFFSATLRRTTPLCRISPPPPPRAPCEQLHRCPWLFLSDICTWGPTLPFSSEGTFECTTIHEQDLRARKIVFLTSLSVLHTFLGYLLLDIGLRDNKTANVSTPRATRASIHLGSHHILQPRTALYCGGELM